METEKCLKTCCLIRHLAEKLAPVLLEVKPASLLRLTNCRHPAVGKQFDLFSVHELMILSELKLECRILKRNSSNLVVLFYRTAVLTRHLAQPQHAAFLRECGYSGTLSGALDELARRCETNRDFPHEIGAFLGYPLKDVRGFLENPAGCLSVPRGLWRVSGDPAESLAAMAAFRDAENRVKNLFEAGKPLATALREIHLSINAA